MEFYVRGLFSGGGGGASYHVVSFHILTIQMFVLTSGSLTRLVYQLFSDCQYQLSFFLS